MPEVLALLGGCEPRAAASSGVGTGKVSCTTLGVEAGLGAEDFLPRNLKDKNVLIRIQKSLHLKQLPRVAHKEAMQ